MPRLSYKMPTARVRVTSSSLFPVHRQFGTERNYGS